MTGEVWLPDEFTITAPVSGSVVCAVKPVTVEWTGGSPEALMACGYSASCPDGTINDFDHLVPDSGRVEISTDDLAVDDGCSVDHAGQLGAAAGQHRSAGVARAGARPIAEAAASSAVTSASRRSVPTAPAPRSGPCRPRAGTPVQKALPVVDQRADRVHAAGRGPRAHRPGRLRPTRAPAR